MMKKIGNNKKIKIEFENFKEDIHKYKPKDSKEQKIINKEEKEKRIEEVPREVTITDYYAVEYLRQYIPQYIPERQIEYVAKERKVKKY